MKRKVQCKNGEMAGQEMLKRLRTGQRLLLGFMMVLVVAMPGAGQAKNSAEGETPAAARRPPVKKAQPGAAEKEGAQAPPAGAAALPGRSAAAPVCVGEFAATAHVNLPEGKSGLLDLQRLKLPSPAWLRTIGDQDVLQVEPMTSQTPRAMFFLFGKKVGSTNLMFQNREGNCAMVEVLVGIDTAAVKAKLEQLIPGEKDIRVAAAADSLVLSGTVSDAIAVEKVMAIAGAYVRKAGTGQGNGSGNERIVNMMAVAAPQQVMLEVKVAEISKTLLDQLGVGFSGTLNRGNWAARLASNFLTGGSGALNLSKPGSNEFLTIDAEKRDGLVKILAEPTIMAISGQEGSFLAGGKIFIPVAQSGTGGAVTITLEEKEFGVGLRFTPTVLDGGRINLKVAPEVSELSREGVGVRTTGVAGSAVLPLITTRRAATTVQLYDGQSFAIGGLIKSNVVQNIKALPILGEVPVLGALFRSSDFQTDRTELVFIVTPHLAKALPPDYVLPTDGFVPPSRSEFFLGGKMEGSAPSAPPQRASASPANQSVPPSGFDLK